MLFSELIKVPKRKEGMRWSKEGSSEIRAREMSEIVDRSFREYRQYRAGDSRTLRRA
jgi:hypothetical protein